MKAPTNHRPPASGPASASPALGAHDFLDTMPFEDQARSHESPALGGGSPLPIDLALARFEEASSALAMSAQAIRPPALASARAVAPPPQARPLAPPAAPTAAPARRRLAEAGSERALQIAWSPANALSYPVTRAGLVRWTEVAPAAAAETRVAIAAAPAAPLPAAASGCHRPTVVGPSRRAAGGIVTAIAIASVLVAWARHASTMVPTQPLDGASQPTAVARHDSVTESEASNAAELLERAPTGATTVASPAPVVTGPVSPPAAAPRLADATAWARARETPRTPPQTASISAAVAAAQAKADAFLRGGVVHPEAGAASASAGL
jgi:hypothetical protein